MLSTHEPATVRVDSRPASLDASGMFVGGVQVTTGTTRFTVTATDSSGNTAVQAYDVDQAGTSRTFTFDANGNLVSDGIRTFQWDARNQFVALDSGNRQVEFAYNGLRRRVRTVEKQNGITVRDALTMWCGITPCEERSADGAAPTRRVFSQGEQIAGVPRFFSTDHLRSVRDVTGQTGASLERYEYEPWGRRLTVFGSGDTSTGFTGDYWSADLGWLTAYRAYDPSLGRWLSEDPLQFSAGPNFYSYVMNHAISEIDPAGLQTYNPRPWNEPGTVRTNNCYSYACDRMHPPGPANKPQPGDASGQQATDGKCLDLKSRARADGLKNAKNGKCECDYFPVRLYYTDNFRGSGLPDYHWYRQDSNGRWSSKHGLLPVEAQIDDPGKDALAWGYSVFCGTMCAPKK